MTAIQPVTIKRGDTRPLVIKCSDVETGEYPDFTTGLLELRFLATLDGVDFIDDDTVVGSSVGGIVRAWGAGETDTAGTLLCEVKATWEDGTVETYPAEGFIEIVIAADLTPAA